MGTRHLIAIHIDNEYKVAQYGQWDGYPSGQGITIIEFLHQMQQEGFSEEFKNKVRACRFLSGEEQKALWVSAGADPESDFVSMEVSDRFKSVNPQLSRDAGADVLSMIASSTDGLPLRDSLSFAADSLFCEYAYVLDFDSGKLEVYTGFNKTPLDSNERFAHLPKEGDYEPVKLWKTFDLLNPPSEEDFLSECEENEEAEA